MYENNFRLFSLKVLVFELIPIFEVQNVPTVYVWRRDSCYDSHIINMTDIGMYCISTLQYMHAV
jgi:hypothetical protein